MTLTKTKARPVSAAHRKRVGAHHRRTNSYRKIYWPYLPIVAIILLGLFSNSWLQSRGRNVLGYATDMSASGLLGSTNTQRSANGLGALALSSVLSQAAQNKANDMVAKDYWSHNSPSGDTPWSFIMAVGYSYQTAGENLAYGFTSASDTVDGWMNSPGHRANILNTTFKEVGFGVANAPNFQGGGPETIVVAMYALPTTSAPAIAASPAPAASTPVAAAQTPASTNPVKAVTPSPTTVSSGSGEAASADNGGQAAEQPVATESKNSTISLPKNATTRGDSAERAKAADDVASRQISRVSVIGAANVAWGQFAVSMLASVALLVFLLRHSLAWHRTLVKGERFLLHHPLLDVLFVSLAAAGFVLLQHAGTIR